MKRQSCHFDQIKAGFWFFFSFADLFHLLFPSFFQNTATSHSPPGNPALESVNCWRSLRPWRGLINDPQHPVDGKRQRMERRIIILPPPHSLMRSPFRWKLILPRKLILQILVQLMKEKKKMRRRYAEALRKKGAKGCWGPFWRMEDAFPVGGGHSWKLDEEKQNPDICFAFYYLQLWKS